MFAQQRRQAIVQKLYSERAIKVSALMELFGVSIETIRRDLEHLEMQDVLKRVHGGAVLADTDYKHELHYTVRNMKHIDAKMELAETAARLVAEGQSIAVDVSTTNTVFIKALKRKVEKLTVLTNSLPIVNELVDMPQYTIIFAGGVIRNEERCTTGDFAELFVSQFHVDTFFMSASGISLEEGVTDYGIGEVQVKKRMQQCANHTILLADSSKFEQVSLLKVCQLDSIAKIVTDSHIDRNLVGSYKEKGIQVVFE